MFERKPLRQQVQKEILARLADHRLPAGTRINESHLSQDLGISRTPLREAMLGLEAAGFLGSDMGRGFLVPPISSEEFRQTQAMLGRLAPFALAMALPVPSAQIMELHNLLGRARIRTAEPGRNRGTAVAEVVSRWSSLTLRGCPNRMLVTDIGRLEALSQRCWNEAVILGFEPGDMVAGYGKLYELLRADQRDAAVAAWADHIASYSAEAAEHLPGPS